MKKKKCRGCKPFCLVPTGEKPKRMETEHPKTGSEPKNVRLCSLMFAYVRLIGKKIVAAQRAEFSGQPGLIKPKILRTRSIFSLAGWFPPITLTPPSHHCVRGQL